MIKAFIQKVKNFCNYVKQESKKDVYRPRYKLIEILKEEEQYVVVVKVINQNMIQNIKPEEILANDELVDYFSPRDIRTLTYLGYLGINSPKYKILAKKLSEDDKVTFIIKKKGEEKVIVKTAEELINETDIVLSLNSEDAKTVGYTAASESIMIEKKQKEALHKEQIIKDISESDTKLQ